MSPQRRPSASSGSDGLSGSDGPSGSDGVRERAVRDVESAVVALFGKVRAGAATAAKDVHAQLTVSAYRILLRVNEESGSRITDLAGHFQVGKPTMSRQVAALEQLGLVARRPDPADGRGALVSLTDDGRAAFARARARRHEWIAGWLREFTDSEVQAFATLLSRFVRGTADESADHTEGGTTGS